MRVEECKKCAFYTRRKWTQFYAPVNYHPIGMTHEYGFCTKHNKRCSRVKKCEDIATKT